MNMTEDMILGFDPFLYGMQQLHAPCTHPTGAQITMAWKVEDNFINKAKSNMTSPGPNGLIYIYMYISFLYKAIIYTCTSISKPFSCKDKLDNHHIFIKEVHVAKHTGISDIRDTCI